MTRPWPTGDRFHSLSRIVLWAALSAVPVIPYTFPLFQTSLSNSPTAYLIWIPLLGFFWAGWNLNKASDPSHVDHSLWLAVLSSVVVGSAFWAGAYVWPQGFMAYDIGLLLWPLWSLAMLWILYGVAAIRAALYPMAYLLLVWPPLYLQMITLVNPFLAAVTISLVQRLAGLTSWVRMGSSANLFDVRSAAGWVTVLVSNACSGSDSILAILVLLPVILALFRVSHKGKAALVTVGCILAFIFNVIRICLIIFALHAFGYRVAFDILHPVLGAVFFSLIIVTLLTVGSRKAVFRSPARTLLLACRQAPLRVGLAMLFSAATAVLLFPLYLWSAGSALRPLSLSTNHILSLMPRVPGYERYGLRGISLVAGTYGKWSGGSATFVRSGHLKVDARIWWMKRPWTDTWGRALAGLSTTVLWQHPERIHPGISGMSFLVGRSDPAHPLSQTLLVETVYTCAAVYETQRVYLGVVLSSVVAPDIGHHPEAASSVVRQLMQSLEQGAPGRWAQYDGFGRAFMQSMVKADEHPNSGVGP